MMPKPELKLVVLTGPSGAGKSTLKRFLARRGWRVLDADKIAKGLYARGLPAWHAIKAEFGPGVLGHAGHVDRGKLGEEVFLKPGAMRRLDKLMIPLLLKELRRRLPGPKAKACVAVDMAIYFKAGAPDFGGKVVLVDAPLRLRLRRILARGPKSRRRALAQASSLKFGPRERRGADLVLINDASPEAMFSRFKTWLKLT